MKIAEDLGLPIESINQAGAHFLYKIPNYTKNLVLLYKGKRATIYRPNTMLFFQLKIPRLLESDFQDCFQFLRFAKKTKEKIDKKSIEKMLNQELKETHSYQKKEKLKHLLNML